jgi:Uma2 family endonuclease
MRAIPAGFSPQAYLALEHQHRIRHEYRLGLVYAMAGGSDAHSRPSINLLTAINLHLRDGHCQFFSVETLDELIAPDGIGVGLAEATDQGGFCQGSLHIP